MIKFSVKLKSPSLNCMNQNKEKEINIEPISELLGANGITSEM